MAKRLPTLLLLTEREREGEQVSSAHTWAEISRTATVLDDNPQLLRLHSYTRIAYIGASYYARLSVTGKERSYYLP